MYILFTGFKLVTIYSNFFCIKYYSYHQFNLKDLLVMIEGNNQIYETSNKVYKKENNKNDH